MVLKVLSDNTPVHQSQASQQGFVFLAEEAEDSHDDQPPSDMETDKASAQCTGKTGKENGNIIKRKAVLYDSDDE